MTGAKASGITLLLLASFAGVAAPSEAAVDYGLHDVFNPSSWNGKRVYLSPGHSSSSPNVFPCGKYSTSEWAEAWHMGRDFLRDYLLRYGFKVMMPKRDPYVGLTTRVDTAYDWGAHAYVPIHSNAGIGNCGSTQGGTMLLTQNAADRALGQSVLDQLAPISPGSSHDRIWDNFCGSRAITELCTTKALAMPTGYIELEFHDTGQGANWIVENHDVVACRTALGIARYLGIGSTVPCGGSFIVRVLSPPDGAWVRGNVLVRGVSNQEGNLAWMRILIDGTVVRWITPAPHEWTWDTRGYSNGAHTVVIEAQNLQGVRDSESVRSLVDNAPPTARIDRPADNRVYANDVESPAIPFPGPAAGTTVVAGKVTIRGSGSDSHSGVDAAVLAIDGAARGSWEGGGSYSYLWDATLATPGTHTITLTLRDGAGNSATATQEVVVA